jgi:hypothetical protein
MTTTKIVPTSFLYFKKPDICKTTVVQFRVF